MKDNDVGNESGLFLDCTAVPEDICNIYVSESLLKSVDVLCLKLSMRYAQCIAVGTVTL